MIAKVPVGVVDLGTGNLFSVLRGLERAGAAPTLVTDAASIATQPRLVLPGVGAFADAAARAHRLGLAAILRERVDAGTPLLGICLGLQLLFDEGDEDGPARGLGLLAGRVVKLRGGDGLQVPHVGWQRLNVRRDSPITLKSGGSPWFYFSHSYRVEAEGDVVVADAEHGEAIPAIVASGRVFGVQPHPEKSGAAGNALLQRFLALDGRPA